MSQLVGTQEGQVLVTAYQWASFFEPHFAKLVGIKKLQHFRFDSSSPGIVFVREYSDSRKKQLHFSLTQLGYHQHQTCQQLLKDKDYRLSANNTCMTRSETFAPRSSKTECARCQFVLQRERENTMTAKTKTQRHQSGSDCVGTAVNLDIHDVHAHMILTRT